MKSAALLFAVPLLLLAGDFWKEKKPADWSEKEAKKMTLDSPWAHEATPRLEGGIPSGMPTGGRGGRGGRGGGGGGVASAETGSLGDIAGGGGGEMGGGGGGMGGGGLMASMPAVHVRWDSAAPVREAFGKLDVQNPFPKELADRAANYYVITVEDMRVPMGRPQGGAKGGPQGQQGDRQALTQEDLKRMQERMLQATALVRKDKEPLKPEGVRVIAGAKGPTFQFFFPKSDPIVADEKEVKLVMKVGPLTVETKFKPKDMVFGGALAL